MYVLYFLLWFQHQLFHESGKNLRTVSEAQRKRFSILSESISGGNTNVSLKADNVFDLNF